MAVTKNTPRRVGVVVLLLCIAAVATGCAAFGLDAGFGGSPPSEIAFLRSKPAYVFTGAGGEVVVTPGAYNIAGEKISESLRGEVRYIGPLPGAEDANVMAARSGALSTTPDSGLDENGVFRAEREGLYEITLSNRDRSVELTVPVTVVPGAQTSYADVVMEFTDAVEAQDSQRMGQLLTDDFVLFVDFDGAAVPAAGGEDLLQALPVIAGWRLEELTVTETGEETAVVEGMSTLETIEYVDGGRTIYGIEKNRVALHLVAAEGEVRLREMYLKPIPVEGANWPRVKAAFKVPQGDVLSAEGYFEYEDGFINEGGSGYFVALTELEYPGGTASSWNEPSWINAGSSIVGGGYSSYFLFEPGHVRFEVRLLSGPTPNQLVETDRQVFEYTVE